MFWFSVNSCMQYKGKNCLQTKKTRETSSCTETWNSPCVIIEWWNMYSTKQDKQFPLWARAGSLALAASSTLSGHQQSGLSSCLIWHIRWKPSLKLYYVSYISYFHTSYLVVYCLSGPRGSVPSSMDTQTVLVPATSTSCSRGTHWFAWWSVLKHSFLHKKNCVDVHKCALRLSGCVICIEVV